MMSREEYKKQIESTPKPILKKRLTYDEYLKKCEERKKLIEKKIIKEKDNKRKRFRWRNNKKEFKLIEIVKLL